MSARPSGFYTRCKTGESVQPIPHVAPRGDRSAVGAVHTRRAVIFDDLRAIQHRHGFLPKPELEALSQRTSTPLYQIHSVASFYPHFHLAPPAESRHSRLRRHELPPQWRRGVTPRSRASLRIITAKDVLIRDVSCLGRCDQARAVSINDHIFTGMTGESAEAIARDVFRGEPIEDPRPNHGPVRCTSDPYLARRALRRRAQARRHKGLGRRTG